MVRRSGSTGRCSLISSIENLLRFVSQLNAIVEYKVRLIDAYFPAAQVNILINISDISRNVAA